MRPLCYTESWVTQTYCDVPSILYYSIIVCTICQGLMYIREYNAVMLYYTPRHITYSTTGSGFCQGFIWPLRNYSEDTVKFFADRPQTLTNTTYHIS